MIDDHSFDGQGRRQPKTEWAGMTDWAEAGQKKEREPETEWGRSTGSRQLREGWRR